MTITIRRVTADRWQDFEKLFGKNGACDGCWCMWWRLKRSEYSAARGERNKLAIKRIILRGEQPGLIAYINSEPAGWCCVGPREYFPVIERSPNLKPLDPQPAWSIVCLFVARQHRRHGITARLVAAAVEHAAARGAKIVEAYPMDKKGENIRGTELFTGMPATYRKAGFTEVARRSPLRPIMRKRISRKDRSSGS